MSQPKRRSALCLTLLLILAAPIAATTLEEIDERSLPFAAGERLELSNTNGSVRIESWDREEIQIEARKKAKARDDETARKVMDAITIEIDQTAGATRVETRLPRRGDGIMDWLSGNNVSASVSYTIRLPRAADLDVVTVNGSIKISAVQGVLDLSSTNGAITVSESGGSVTAGTTNGSIEAELTHVDPGEDMKMRTTNGSIRLRVPAEISADLSARTTNGSIRSDLPIQIQGSMSRRKIEGEINGGGGRIELRTTNGSIKILEL